MKANMQHPLSLQEAIIYFSNTKRCVDFLAELRWGKGEAACPKCGSMNVKHLSTRQVWQCREKECKKQFSVKVGTIFEKSPVPLTKWLPVVWMIFNDKNGISSYEVAREIRVTQKTSWFMLHRVREAMRTGSFNKKLSGMVEADATYIGGLEKFKHKDKKTPTSFKKGVRGGLGKTTVLGMLERGGEIRAMVVKSENHLAEIEGHVIRNIADGTKLMTDGHGTYSNIALRNPLAYEHEFVNHMDEYVRGEVHTNGLENFWCLLKRSIKGTYTQVAPFHVDRYLDEQMFRYNNRKATNYERFVLGLSQIVGRRLTYAELTGATAAA
jgi:transposase-like protein